MTKLLGVGGECVVIEKYLDTENCALRLSEMKASGEMREIGGVPVEVDINATYNALNVPDMAVKNLVHDNIIKYLDNTFELIDGRLHHVTGKHL